MISEYKKYATRLSDIFDYVRSRGDAPHTLVYNANTKRRLTPIPNTQGIIQILRDHQRYKFARSSKTQCLAACCAEDSACASGLSASRSSFSGELSLTLGGFPLILSDNFFLIVACRSLN